MNVEEFDTALTDLETRVDRLRALYENWFRGYEKMEPGVARKDVERRVYGLRKELPRNTALRFRYHQLYQRYTTLASYWQRTARQIEEGTYRLHLQRLKRRRDDDVARTLAPPPRAAPDDTSAPPPPTFELNLDETLDVRNLLDDFDLDQVANALDVHLPHPESLAPSKITANLASHVRSTGRLSVPNAAALGAVRPEAGAAAASASAAGGPADAGAAPRTSARFARPNAEAAPRSVVGNSQRPPAMSPANDVVPTRPATNGAAKPPAVPPAARGPATGTMPMPPPPPAAATAARPSGTGSYGIPPPPGRVPPPPAAKPPARPAIPTSAAPVMPRPAAPAPAPVAPAAAGSAALSDQRMRKIYDEYTAARRKNNEGDVRFETLSGSIQKMLPDLTKRHAGKQIDFEVVVKDGRVGLKPKAT